MGCTNPKASTIKQKMSEFEIKQILKSIDFNNQTILLNIDENKMGVFYDDDVIEEKFKKD